MIDSAYYASNLEVAKYLLLGHELTLVGRWHELGTARHVIVRNLGNHALPYWQY